MKKMQFLSLFLTITTLIIPTCRADVIKPDVHKRLRSTHLYRHVKTILEINIKSALRSATPQSYILLIKLFGSYCLVIADHIHWSAVDSHSVRVPGVPRAVMPADVSKIFSLQKKIYAKLQRKAMFRGSIPGTPIVVWSYAGGHYLCNPDLVYDQLPEKYRQESLELVDTLSQFLATPKMHSI